MRDSDKIALMRDIYEAVFEAVESFEEDHIGADLAYLLGAIVNDSHCEWERGRPFVNLLSGIYPLGIAIWDYIVIYEPEDSTRSGSWNS